MTNRWVFVALLAAIVAAVPAMLSAQQWPPAPPPPMQAAPPAAAPAPKARQAPRPQAQQQDPNDVEELTPGQIQRAQERDTGAPKSAKATPPKNAAPTPPRVVACSGLFAKDSGHLRLAAAFGSQNIAFTEVDGPDGTKLMATVLFPKDPKRRLEIIWQNEAARAGTALIVINGQSGWGAPKGLRLGLQLAALEKLNGKPFKLKGFGKDNVAAVADWDGGALAALPGGCKVGVHFKPDPKAPPEARAEASADREFASADAAIKAARPMVAEILLGY